jgi:hypothetical protein
MYSLSSQRALTLRSPPFEGMGCQTPFSPPSCHLRLACSMLYSTRALEHAVQHSCSEDEEFRRYGSYFAVIAASGGEYVRMTQSQRVDQMPPRDLVSYNGSIVGRGE